MLDVATETPVEIHGVINTRDGLTIAACADARCQWVREIPHPPERSAADVLAEVRAAFATHMADDHDCVRVNVRILNTIYRTPAERWGREL